MTTGDITGSIAGTSTGSADAEIVAFLIAAVARFTKQDESAINPQADLVDMGMQSIDAVILSGEVEDRFEIELDPATVFEHDTLQSFAHEIAQRRAQS